MPCLTRLDLEFSYRDLEIAVHLFLHATQCAGGWNTCARAHFERDEDLLRLGSAAVTWLFQEERVTDDCWV